MKFSSSQTGLLVRHFYSRFLYNDFISPNGEAQATVPMLLGFLAVPGILLLLALFFAYSSPFLSPSERMVLALGHKYQFIALSMIVTALATTLQWDALGLDARDLANLGPLPISSRTLVLAKSIALLLFVSTFALALNLIPTIGFPLTWMSLVPIGFRRGLALSAAHGLITLAAAAFGFFSVLALRSLVLVVGGPRLFRRLSVGLQFVLVLGLVTAFFLTPIGAAGVRQSIAQGSLAARLSPPAWFLGAYEAVTARGLFHDRQLMARTKWSFWQGLPKPIQERLDPQAYDRIIARYDGKARREYDRLQPALDGLAVIAVTAFATVLFAALFLYAVAHARYSRRFRESLVPVVPRAGPFRHLAAAAASALVARHPLTRAAFSFTIKALARSGRHRLYLAGYLALGLALAAISVGPALTGSNPTGAGSVLLLQAVLSFFLLSGARAVVPVPAERPSNWLFQVSWTGGFARYLAGVRRAFAFALALPLLLALVPVHAAWLGWPAALQHLVFGWLASLVLIELLLVGCRKLAFTCSYVPKGTFKYAWPGYVAAFIVYAYGLTALERRAMALPGGMGILTSSMACALLALWAHRAWRLRRPPDVIFDESPEPAAVALGL